MRAIASTCYESGLGYSIWTFSTHLLHQEKMPHIQFCRASQALANGYNLIFSRKNPKKEFEIKTKRRCLNFYSIFFRKIEGCTNQFQASSYHTKTLNDKTLDSFIVYLNLDSYGIKRNQSVILFSIAI